jgi:hypothetical protein
MMATGGNAVHPTDRRAGEGHPLRLIQCSRPSNAPDNSVGKLANRLKSSRAVVPPIFPPRHLGGQGLVNSLSPFYSVHVVPRRLSSLFVTESEITMEAFEQCAKNIGRT